VDVFTRERRSEIMRRIASKHTQPEKIVRRVLHRMGYRFRLHGGDLPGNPDVVLPRWRIVVFVHGCFWHGHRCKKGSSRRRPKSNTDYWNAKLDRNVRRDKRHGQELQRLGWKRIVIWACETKDEQALEARLRRVLPPYRRRPAAPV
jgi:DNA mismatch endonuclease (patch repair protein)